MQPGQQSPGPLARPGSAPLPSSRSIMDPSPFSAQLSGCQTIAASELKFEEEIGKGGYGQVWRARWRDDIVAVKQLFLGKHEHGTDEALEIEREIKMLFECEHPYITQLHGCCPNPRSIVMEFCEASVRGMLEKAVKGKPDALQCLTWRKRLVMLGQVASGMHYLHSRNIIHGDLRSHNLLLDFFLRIKIGDFGLSRTLNSRSHYSASRTTNARWVAPEVMTSNKLTTASDVYSFGIVMWEMLTFEIPFKGSHDMAICFQVPQWGIRPDIPADDQLPGQPGPTLAQYKELMSQCWAQNPDDRPTFAEIWERVQVMIGQESESSLEPQDTLDKPVLSVSIHHGQLSDQARTCSDSHSDHIVRSINAFQGKQGLIQAVGSTDVDAASQDLDSPATTPTTSATQPTTPGPTGQQPAVAGALSPTPSPPPPILNHPDSLDDLLDILAEAQTSSITIDLKYQDLCVSRSEGRHLVIRRPVLLCNGTLNLPRGVGIVVVSAGVTLKSMTLTSAGLAVSGLVTVLEQGVVRLESCGLSICGAEDGPGTSGSPAGCGVIVESGSHADMKDVRISGAPGAGLKVSGSANAESCHISRCNNGFTVTGCGALLTISGCTAKGNREAGYFAENAGWLTCMSNCVAEHCGVGFCSTGKGSSLIAGPGSRAEHNKGCGFRASDGGKLVTAEGCAAVDNHVGMAAYDEDSCLTVGRGCLARKNTAYGFAAWIGGKMIVGDECRSEQNHVGFGSYDPGSSLYAGKGCVADTNEEFGFMVSGGAKMATGSECVAIGNKLGFASGEYSSLQVGPGSRVARSKEPGGAVSDDGATPNRDSATAGGSNGLALDAPDGVQLTPSDRELQAVASPSGGSYQRHAQAAVRIIHGLASKPLTFLKDIRSLSSNGWGIATTPGATQSSPNLAATTPGATQSSPHLTVGTPGATHSSPNLTATAPTAAREDAPPVGPPAEHSSPSV